MLSIKSSQSTRLNHGPAGTEMKRTIPMQFCDDANEKIFDNALTLSREGIQAGS